MAFFWMLIAHLVLAVITGINVHSGDYGFAAYFFCMYLSSLALMVCESLRED